MATLNTAKQETKTILMLVGFAFVAIMLFFMVIRILNFIRESFSPPPPPEVAFGKLPPIPFPEKTKENLSFTLDTVSGYLPVFPDRTKVYKIINEPPSLTGLDKTREKVINLGFNPNGIQISEDTYRWIDNSSPQRTININIFTSDFNLFSPYLTTNSLQFLNEYEKERSSTIASSFLSKIAFFPIDISETKTKIRQYDKVGTTLTPTTKISNTKIIKVDFFQKDIDKLPIYYDKGISSTIEFNIGKIENDLRVLDGRFHHKNISDKASTYPIKSASEAFSELKDGKAYIAYLPTNTVEFKIKNVALGYYIGEAHQDYLMPIIIFEGTNDLRAYVSAVRDELIDK